MTIGKNLSTSIKQATPLQYFCQTRAYGLSRIVCGNQLDGQYTSLFAKTDADPVPTRFISSLYKLAHVCQMFTAKDENVFADFSREDRLPDVSVTNALPSYGNQPEQLRKC